MDNNINQDLYSKLCKSIDVYIETDCDVLELVSDYMSLNRKAYDLDILPKDIYMVNLNTIDKAYDEYLNHRRLFIN